jgi:hypothetical protein
MKAFTKTELAQKLRINPDGLEKFKYPAFYKILINKISLPLISVVLPNL